MFESVINQQFDVILIKIRRNHVNPTQNMQRTYLSTEKQIIHIRMSNNIYLCTHISEYSFLAEVVNVLHDEVLFRQTKL